MLEINHLSVAYGSNTILKDVTLEVSAGQVLAVIGPNGAGKSTLVKASSGVLSAKRGRITVNGKDIARLSASERARMMAVVPQARSLPLAFSVYQAVLLGRTPHINWLGQPKLSDHQQVLRALELTHSMDLSERRIGELSGGEQQRVLLARAIAQQTPVLLLDEPTTHLDLKHQSSFLNLIRKLAVEQNLAILLVIHDLNLGSLYSDKMALILDGQIQALGTPKEGIKRSQSPKSLSSPSSYNQAPGLQRPHYFARRAEA